MPGYAEPVIFKKVFEFVVQQSYKRQSMIDWIRGRLEKEAEG
jgi:thioredoxin-related protein